MRESTNGLLRRDEHLSPTNLYLFLYRLKEEVVFRIYHMMIQTLSDSQAVRLKESMKLTGRLDYSQANIVMSIDSLVQQKRLASCRKEPETIRWIEKYVQPGDVFYDVGANVGAYSFVAFSVASGDCKVYAFEPSFATFAALSQNVMLNKGHGKILPMHLALSDETRLFEFDYSNISPGAARHNLEASNGAVSTSKQSVFTQRITSYRLDDLIAQFGLLPPSHIKIDVDGTELRVLKGAIKTLANHELRTLLIEVDSQADPTDEIGHLLHQSGFRLESRCPRGGSETLANHVFVRH